MSRVGNNPITIPDGVSVEISENKIIVKGKLGEIEQEFSDVTVKMSEGTLKVERVSEAKNHKSKHGLYRALINNMVIGVSEGWTKEFRRRNKYNNVIRNGSNEYSYYQQNLSFFMVK